VRALLAALVLGLASCGSCKDDSAGKGDDGRASPPVHTVAGVPGPVDALVAARGTLFGISRSLGLVFAASEEDDGPGTVREIARGEKEPFALTLRAGKPVWASLDGVFASDEDGRNRRALVAGRAVRSLGSGPHDVLFGDEDGIWRIEWPAAATPIQVTADVAADELVATVENVVWLDHGKAGSVWSFDLKTRTKRELATTQRRPHDLSVSSDGHSVFWHEGETDPLPGRAPRAFLADTVTGAVRELPGVFASNSEYLVRGPRVVGPGVCKPLAQVDWIALGHGSAPGVVAADSERLYWVMDDRIGAAPEASRIVSTPLSSSCP